MEIVTYMPIDPSEVYEVLKKDTAGSVVLHYAVVKGNDENKKTVSLEFHASGDLATELRTISLKIREQWKIEDVLIIRRLGTLHDRDIISLVAVSSPHREDAFNACRYGVELLKKMTTIVKKETIA